MSNLDLFFGDLTVSRAYVYARLPRAFADEGWTITGVVRGPRCQLAETLPGSVPLVDLGPGPTVLSRAVIADPVFWTPDLPAIYDVTARVLRGNEVLAEERREIGLRPLGVRGQNLVLASQRWVLRGMHSKSVEAAPPDAWHDAASAFYLSLGAAMVDLDAVSAHGVPCIVAVEAKESEGAAAALRSLARHPGVAMAVLSAELPADFQPGHIAPNILAAQYLESAMSATIQPWAQLVLLDAHDPQWLAEVYSSIPLPKIAVRQLAAPLQIDEARAACDRLQSDLASVGQFAGYVV